MDKGEEVSIHDILRKQKYKVGQRVKIVTKDKMPKSMQHFKCDIEVIIVGTYAHICGYYSDEDLKIYKVETMDGNKVSWYPESTLKEENK